MKTTTHLENGVGTVVAGPFKNYPFPYPMDYVTDFDDFITYTAAHWTVTETDAAATEATTDGKGGLLLITNTAADNDAVVMQRLGESFLFVAGKQTFFSARFKVSDATQSDILFGLVITDTTPLAHTDGVIFRKDDGDANIDFASVKNSVGSSAVAVGTLVDNTFTELAFYYDGKNCLLFKDGVLLSRVADLIIPDDEEVRVTLMLQNGEAVAKTMTVDWIFAAQER